MSVRGKYVVPRNFQGRGRGVIGRGISYNRFGGGNYPASMSSVDENRIIQSAVDRIKSSITINRKKDDKKSVEKFSEDELKERIKKLGINREINEEEEEKDNIIELAALDSTEALIICDIKQTMRSILRKPINMIVIVLAAVVVLSHSSGIDQGFMKDLKKEYANSTIMKWLIVSANFERFLGMCVYIPAIWDMPNQYRLGVASLAGIWLFVMPNMGMLEYFVQALLLHTFVRCQLNSTRMALVFASVAMFLFGILTFKSKT